MSVSFYASAIIGVRLDKIKLYKSVIRKSCDHEMPVPNCKYCPTCGKLVITFFDDISVFEEGLPNDISLVNSTDRNEIFAYVKGCRTNFEFQCKYEQLKDGDIVSSKHRLMEVLAPYDLWDETLFGLWAVPYVNY